jgi:hypothetical protein
MGIKDYLAVLCRRMWIVILVPLIATGVSAFMVFFVLEPVYESTTTLYIVDKKFTYPASTGSCIFLSSGKLVNLMKPLPHIFTISSASSLKLDHLLFPILNISP